MDKLVKDLDEIQVLDHHRFNEAFISQGYRPDWDVSIKHNNITTNYEIKTQKIYNNNDDDFVVEIAEISADRYNGRYVDKKDRFKNGIWYKTALLLSKADRYVLIKKIVNKKPVIGDEYRYYEINKEDILKPILEFLKSKNITIGDREIKINNNDFNIQIENLAKQAYENFKSKKGISSDKIKINNHGALDSFNVTTADWPDSGKYDIVFNFKMNKINWDSKFNGNFIFKYEISDDIINSYKGQKIYNDDEGNQLIDLHFKSDNPKGSGKYVSSSESSSSSSEDDGTCRKVYNRLKRIIDKKYKTKKEKYL
jgi:hypothetical protein